MSTLPAHRVTAAPCCGPCEICEIPGCACDCPRCEECGERYLYEPHGDDPEDADHYCSLACWRAAMTERRRINTAAPPMNDPARLSLVGIGLDDE